MNRIKVMKDHRVYEFSCDDSLADWLKALVKHPKKDVRITKSEAIVLYVLGAHDRGGRRFTDIQRFLCKMNGYPFEGRDETCPQFIWTLEGGKKISNKWGHDHWIEDNRWCDYSIINNHLFSSKKKYDATTRKHQIHSVTNHGRVVKTFRFKGPRSSRGYGCTWLYGGFGRTGLLYNCCYKYEGRWFVKTQVRRKLSLGEKIYFCPQTYVDNDPNSYHRRDRWQKNPRLFAPENQDHLVAPPDCS